MRRSFSRIICVAALPGLLTLNAQAAPRVRCGDLSSYDRVKTAPAPIGPDARGEAVPVANRTIFAQDVAQTAEEGWRLPAELRVAINGLVLIYPAGLEIAPERIDQPNRICLPSTSTGDDWQPLREPCLIDRDKDGAFEQVEMIGWNPRMHVIQKRVIATEPLPAPVRPVPNPAGLSASRVHHHRELMMWNVQPDRMDLLIHYGSHRVFGERGALLHGSWQEEPGGVQRYQAPPPTPALTVDQGDIPWDGLGLVTSDQVTIPLTTDRIVKVAGQRIRIARAAEGWTLQVVEDRARPWVRLVCGGRKTGYKTSF